MPKIKCLLVDDHTLFRQGVRRLLESESDFEVVGEAADGGEAVEKARELRPTSC
jgi:Response regulator containing a CheY-like receiver domain and an HTH DNA-binding domain